MCGFTGMFDLNPLNAFDQEALQHMSQSIHFRGPEENVTILNERLGIATRGPSTIDSEQSSQPFTYGDGRYTGIIHGKIYNVQELRNELIEQGYTLTTNLQIEVLLALFSRDGVAFIHSLRGMFAFVFYDEVTHTLTAGRDPFGIKSLCYHHSIHRLVFASEIKPFFFDSTLGGFNLRKDMLQHYFTFQYVPEPDTMAHNITVLSAGHYMTYCPDSDNEPVVTRYYNPIFVPAKDRYYEDKVNEVRDVVSSSVRNHLISDVPVGSFLSSGIDSTIITSIASKLNPGIKAFTIAFDEKQYSEMDDAITISKQLDVEHIKLIANVEDFKNAFETVVYHLDGPVADPSTVAIYLLCQEAAKHVKVVLSGEGADELFGGYRVYDESRYSARIYNLPGFLKAFLKLLARFLPDGVKGKNLIYRGCTPLEDRYVGNAFHYTEKEKPSILRTYNQNQSFTEITHPYYKDIADYSPLRKMQYIDMHTWIHGDILVKADRLSMSHGLEIRVPFLDKEVFQVASSLEDNDKLSHKTTKFILRDAFRDLVDEDTFLRPKKGFPVPVQKWLRKELYPFAKDIIENSTADEYIVKKEALRMLEVHRDGSENNYRKLWLLLVFITWYRLYISDADETKKRILRGELS
ncbi:MAG TPA: asparagine synthase (glutamine-hydrolyzing) [Clostridiales bacterium]|jgi:asparagine synthase (glutamine-hydrolysing)|nr:asparagine synthase (glutamine-hydrolyzing) [Clostridiales bacterium]HBK30494.1 asparagine synthase (glutamine-hydrolyzing) [Porphyromonadaceae bacterium]HCG36635.1 asparagine synthase (glutamine-hydrolyzing) [Clostridiales bacterium]